jgi:snRNA-activating protein complex subunit 3
VNPFRRLQHPSDPVSGYPLTLQVTPTLIDLCRACAKVPAVWAIVGDIRLGESPCLMCGVCWGIMGEPNEDDGVVVLPLPKYEPGWQGRYSNV